MTPGKNPASATPSRKADHDETCRSRYEGACRGKDAPGEHNPGDPPADPDALKDQVAWNLKDKVAKEEYAGPQAVCEGAEPKILVHRQRRHGNIRAIKISDAIGDQNQRQNVPGDLLDQSRFKCLRHVVLLKKRQRQVVRIRSLGQLRSAWQVDYSR